MVSPWGARAARHGAATSRLSGGFFGHARVFDPCRRRLKAGGSQDWLPHSKGHTRYSACRRPLGYGIAQDADSFDLYFDYIAGRHLTGGAGGSRIDDVAGHQGDPAADIAHDGGAIENQVGGVLLLHNFAVEARAEQKGVVVQTGDDGGAEGREGVAALGAPPLHVLGRAVLPVALADVVAAGDAEDGVAGLVHGCVLRLAADDDDELAFVVHVGGVGRGDDGAFGILQGADGFEKDFRMFGHRPAAHVASVIQTDADDLAGLAGMEQGDIGKIQGGYGFSVTAEEVAADLADGVAFQNAVTGGRAGTIANEVVHAWLL